MADALLDIGKALLEPYATDLWDQVNGNEYGDATKSTLAILAAINDAKNSVIQELTAAMLSGDLAQHTTHIATWTQTLADCFIAKHQNEKGADAALERLKAELIRSTDGPAYALNGIDSILRPVSTTGGVGLIKLSCQKLDQDLIDPKQMDKDMCWYLLEMNKFMAAVVRWQTAGLALRLFTADDQPQRDRYTKAWRANIDAQLEYTRECYHPMIRSFKFSFWDKIPESRLWKLRVPKAQDWYFLKYYDRWLHSRGEMISLCDSLPNEPAPTMHFKFSPPFDQPNAQNQSGQWSCLQNAASPGKNLWGARITNHSGSATVTNWNWEVATDKTSPWQCRRFKLCPIDKESRAFKMVIEGSPWPASGFIFDLTFEADHVEGTGWP